MKTHAVESTKPSIRVVVADDHNRVRTGIRLLLAGVSDIQVVGEAVNGMQALELAQTLQPDILLLDVEMPVLNGLEVAARLHASSIGVQILALSAYDDPQYVQGMLENGAAGYLIKDDVPSKLVPALRSVAAGERNWLSKRLR